MTPSPNKKAIVLLVPIVPKAWGADEVSSHGVFLVVWFIVSFFETVFNPVGISEESMLLWQKSIKKTRKSFGRDFTEVDDHNPALTMARILGIPWAIVAFLEQLPDPIQLSDRAGNQKSLIQKELCSNFPPECLKNKIW